MSKIDLTPSYDDKEHAEKQYDKSYGFNKGRPPQSPATSDWRQEAVEENEPFMSVSPREKALMVGTVHGFGHKGGQIKSNLRVSGVKGAHQIGAKRK